MSDAASTEAAADGSSMAGLAELRSCCAVAIATCTTEFGLYAAFFNASAPPAGCDGTDESPPSAQPEERPLPPQLPVPSATVTAQLENLCYPLYDQLRPLILRQKSIDTCGPSWLFTPGGIRTRSPGSDPELAGSEPAHRRGCSRAPLCLLRNSPRLLRSSFASLRGPH